jgi:lysozyme
MARQIGNEGLLLIKDYEQGPEGGFAKKRYLCTAGKPTIGWGHVITDKDRAELWDATIDEAKANQLLMADVAWAVAAVNKYVKVELTQGQFDALVCFVFNNGAEGFIGSTMLKLLNTNDFKGAQLQFRRWNKARVLDKKTGTRVLQEVRGLTRRRWSEEKLFRDGSYVPAADYPTALE